MPTTSPAKQVWIDTIEKPEAIKAHTDMNEARAIHSFAGSLSSDRKMANISTAVMIRLGYVYGNLMVNVQPTNGKLADRARRIIATIAGISNEEAGRLLDESGSVRVAIIMHKFGIGRSDAEARLNAAQGSLRAALGENE